MLVHFGTYQPHQASDSLQFLTSQGPVRARFFCLLFPVFCRSLLQDRTDRHHGMENRTEHWALQVSAIKVDLYQGTVVNDTV
jgi:hypothetical protein